MQFFYFQKKLLLFNVFSFVVFSFVTTGNIKKQMKTRLLKNEEDVLFYGWMLKHYTNTSSLFLFFSQTRCLTEIVSSWSNTYSCRSLSDERCIFPALRKVKGVLAV